MIDTPYWEEELETMNRPDLENLQLSLFKRRLQYVYNNSPMYRRKYDQVNITPDDIQTLDDIRKLPFTEKEDLRESQEKLPPWGDFVCIPPEEGVRVFQTTGTTGKPVKILLNNNDWEKHFYRQFMHHMHGYGITSHDKLYVPFNYGLHIAWWGLQAAFERAGVMVIPGGGLSSENRLKSMLEYKATVICGTPTYMLYLGETARRMGISLQETDIRILIVAGEPGANVPATKKSLEEMWGATCYDDIGSSEISNFGYECREQKGTHVIESMFYVESLDPETLQPVADGEVGEMVITNLITETAPLIRFRIKDLVRLDRSPCDCGRTFLRLNGGILGRTDDMFQFAGINIFPSALENYIREIVEFSDEYQIIIPRQGRGNHLLIKVEPTETSLTLAELQVAKKRLIEKIKLNMTITPEVEIVETGELPRFEAKAKRVHRS
ncbi:MAG: AMP-binding protein [Deltaproteobacteria bacterium]|nr:AMP-binding protein [Deltaproteobacteria bacterium]MBT4637351.1 AMP-binding protein [Deltaproteobacteria bacterium]MBT6500875.1 AMP-binding protein [Deltaproteobacteria bacterium]MBT7150975.1 AMP-binding protein [Deltaproteobacteria bacterium]